MRSDSCHRLAGSQRFRLSVPAGTVPALEEWLLWAEGVATTVPCLQGAPCLGRVGAGWGLGGNISSTSRHSGPLCLSCHSLNQPSRQRQLATWFGGCQ